jgi:hypothetical protein
MAIEASGNHDDVFVPFFLPSPCSVESTAKRRLHQLVPHCPSKESMVVTLQLLVLQ